MSKTYVVEWENNYLCAFVLSRWPTDCNSMSSMVYGIQYHIPYFHIIIFHNIFGRINHRIDIMMDIRVSRIILYNIILMKANIFQLEIIITTQYTLDYAVPDIPCILLIINVLYIEHRCDMYELYDTYLYNNIYKCVST